MIPSSGSSRAAAGLSFEIIIFINFERYIMKLKTNREALIHGLTLVITAPETISADKINEVINMCESIASNMSKEDVDECKRIVENNLNLGV